MSKITKLTKYTRRKRGIRKKISGTSESPRVAVFRSNKHIYAQIIDDSQMKTLASFNDKKLTAKKGTKVEKATLVGKELGELAKKAKITKVVFDRSGNNYHGRVKALADGLREAGLTF